VHMARLRFRTRSAPQEERRSGRVQAAGPARSTAGRPAPRPSAVVEQPAAAEPPYPTSLLELVEHAIDDWSRTLRLMLLVITAASCLAAIIFVLQLHPDRWASVVAVAASVIGVLRFRRRGARDEPPEDGGGE
jgi:hypothetical protein